MLRNSIIKMKDSEKNKKNIKLNVTKKFFFQMKIFFIFYKVSGYKKSWTKFKKKKQVMDGKE